MSYPILYKANETDFTHLGVGVLAESVTAFVVEERNGIFELEMQYPIDGALFSELKNDRLIKVDASPKLKSQRFKIIRITKPASGVVTVYGEHIAYLAQDLTLKPEVPFSGTALSALNTWRTNLVDEHPFTVYSDVQTTGSGKWTIDKVENARRALGGVEGSLLDIYGGEYRFDNYHINLYSQRGDESEALIAYGKNITDLTQEEEIASTYTSIYPFAILRDGENEELLTLPEYFVDSEHVSKYARRKIQVVDFSQDEIDTVAKLRTRAEGYIKQNGVGVPKVNLKVKFIDLSKTLDYEHLKLVEEINLCDVVTIYFDKLHIHTKAKVIKVTWDVLAERYEEIEIGEARSSLSNAIVHTLDGKIERVQQRITTVQVAANGKNRIFRGLDQPTTGMSLNDLWYKPIGDGETEMYQWNGAMWEQLVATGMNDETVGRIEEAKEIAEGARGDAKSVQVSADSILAGLGVETIGETHAEIVDTISLNLADKAGIGYVDGTIQGLETAVDTRINNLQTDIETDLSTKADDVIIRQHIDEENGKLMTSISAIIDDPEASIVGYNVLTQTVDGNVQEIGSIKTNPNETITGYNTLTQTVDGNVSTIAAIKTTPETEIANYQRVVERADLYERVIGSSEVSVKDNVSRIVMADSIFKTEVSDLLEDTSTTVNQLSDSWALNLKNGDDVVTAINASSQGVYIAGKNIVLDGNTVVDGTFTVTDEFFAESMNISKFTTGTLNAANVNLINVNVSNLVGNTSNFVQSAWNGINTNLTINSSGLTSNSSNGLQYRLGATGVEYLADGETRGVIKAYNASDGVYAGAARGMTAYAYRGNEFHIGYQGNPTTGTYIPAITVHGTTGDISLLSDNIRLSVPTIYPNKSSNDNFTVNYVSSGGVSIRNGATSGAGLYLYNSGAVQRVGTGNFVPGVMSSAVSRVDGLQITRTTISGVGGYLFSHSNANEAGIIFADNGYVYIKSTEGTYSVVKPNFGT